MQLPQECERLLKLIPPDEVKRVLGQPDCYIDLSFLGFIEIYENLSQIIPQHFTIVDLGCAYNTQCYYFTQHKAYIGVDVEDTIRFKAPNCELFTGTIKKFIDTQLDTLDLDETFAICSYVPPWYDHDCEFVRKTFKNIFCYYPHNKNNHPKLIVNKFNGTKS